MGAVDGIDFVGTSGLLQFDSSVRSQQISVAINARGRIKDSSFNVVLSEPIGTKFDAATDGGEEQCICHVTIKANAGGDRKNMLSEMKGKVMSANAIMGQRNWLQQFKDAIFDLGDEDEDEAAAGEEGAEKSGPRWLGVRVARTAPMGAARAA